MRTKASPTRTRSLRGSRTSSTASLTRALLPRLDARRPPLLDIAGRFLRLPTLDGRRLAADASAPQLAHQSARAPRPRRAAPGALRLAPRRAPGGPLARAFAGRAGRPARRAEAAAQGLPAGPPPRLRPAAWPGAAA